MFKGRSVAKNGLSLGSRPNYFSCLNSDVVSVLDPRICQAVCLQYCLTVKTVEVSIDVR